MARDSGDRLSERHITALIDRSLIRHALGFTDARDELLRGHPELASGVEEAFEGAGLLTEAGGSHAGPRPELEDYRIVREIGIGGMALVFEAEQLSLGRSVALKILRPQVAASESSLARFRREASVLAHLQHPALVPVHDVGTQGIIRYIAMDFVVGAPLDKVLSALRPSDPRHLRPAQLQAALEQETLRPTLARAVEAGGVAEGRGLLNFACSLAHDVLGALHHAHENGVVHRDVKPANILVREDGRAVITDFGLAQVADDASLSKSGAFLGTPYYASPEQARSSGDADHRTDVFSMGATLYEILTLHRPFEGDSSAEVLRQIGLADPPRPRDLNPRIPAALERAVLRSLHKDPARRFETAAEFAAALAPWADREGAARQRPPAKLPWRACVSTLLALLVVTVALAFWYWPQDDAEAPLEEADYVQTYRRWLQGREVLNLVLEDPADTRLRQQLRETRIDEFGGFEDEEIEVVASILRSMTELPIFATPTILSEFESWGGFLTVPPLRNLSTESLLDLIVQLLDDETFAWTVRDEAVELTTLEDALGETVLVTHPVGDLLWGGSAYVGPVIDRIALPGEYGDDPETSVFASDLEDASVLTIGDIVSLIREFVARETWELDADRFSIDVAGDQVLAIHTPRVQMEVSRFLESLRDLADGPDDQVVSLGTVETRRGDQALERILGEERIDLAFEGSSLEEAIAWFSVNTGANFVIDPIVLDETRDLSIDLERSGLVVGKALELLLRYCGSPVKYLVRHEVVMIVSAEEATGGQVTKMYGVRDLSRHYRATSRPAPIQPSTALEDFEEDEIEPVPIVIDRDSLVDLIRVNLDPESWDADPNNCITVLSDILIVRQTPEVHEHVTRLLAQLRRNAGPPGEDE